jgi:hypothetical protein
MPSVGAVVTTSYLYDVNDERIALGANGATNTYPFKLYNVNANMIYKHIFANGEPVADVKGSTTTATVYYIHDDHLGGSSVISDSNANVAQVLEYYRSVAPVSISDPTARSTNSAALMLRRLTDPNPEMVNSRHQVSMLRPSTVTAGGCSIGNTGFAA